MREVVRGDKHNLRKSANCKAQISIMCGVNDTDLCVAICRFSRVVFVTSNNFTHNLHTCQPSRSRRDSPDLETETRRPARRLKKKPIRPDLSRSTPKNTILNPLLPVLFVLQSEFKFLLFLLAVFHVPVCGRQLSKQKICIIILGHCSVKKFILLSFSSERKKTLYIFLAFFLAVNVWNH